MQGESQFTVFLRFQFHKASALLVFLFSFIATEVLHINWSVVVPTPASQLHEAGTSRPKRLPCLWLRVAIPGMSGLRLSVTHRFQDNHSQEGVGSSCSAPTSFTGSGRRDAPRASKKRQKSGKGKKREATWLCPVCPWLTACCRRKKHIRHQVLLGIKFRKGRPNSAPKTQKPFLI